MERYRNDNNIPWDIVFSQFLGEEAGEGERKRRLPLIFVGGNRIRDEGAKAIAAALLKNQVLTQLNLCDLYYYNITAFIYTCRLQ